MMIEDRGYTAWVAEPLIKNKRDIDIVGKYATTPNCDVETVNRTAAEFGQRGLVRGHICCADTYGAARLLAGRVLHRGHRAADHGGQRRSRVGA